MDINHKPTPVIITEIPVVQAEESHETESYPFGPILPTVASISSTAGIALNYPNIDIPRVLEQINTLHGKKS